MTEETGETEDRGGNRPRTDTDTDPECTQSIEKKGQMKYIFVSDIDEGIIVDFVKQHEEFFDKTHMKSNDKQRKKILGKQLQLPRIYLSALSRSGSRLNIPGMTSSHRTS